MRVLAAATASAIVFGAAGWFAAVLHTEREMRAASMNRAAYWLSRCSSTRELTLETIRNPAQKLQRDDGIFLAPELPDWHECRGRGFILPSDEYEAFVERFKRTERYQNTVTADHVAKEMNVSKEFAHCVVVEKKGAACAALFDTNARSRERQP